MKEIQRVQAILKESDFEPETTSTCHEMGDRGIELETHLAWLRYGDIQGNDSLAILSETPFYPTSGGQIGDTGRILDTMGNVLMRVLATEKLGDLIVHRGTWESSVVQKQGEVVTVIAEVDAERRSAIKANHTATHLMHQALRSALGEHVTQQGSYVGPERLRFDFSNPGGVSAEVLSEVERAVNAEIYRNAPVNTTVEDPEQAKARGVMALFGEKYGERVRVVDVGGYSTELCGGTHVSAAGEIGPFVILSERAIQAGVRRIEAVTRGAAVLHQQEQRALLNQAAHTLKTNPDGVPERLAALQDQLKEARKKRQASAGADVASEFDAARAALTEQGGIQAGVVDVPNLGAGDLRELADRVRSLSPDLAVGLFGRDGERVPYILICQGRAQEAGLNAGILARALAEDIGGGGGGKPGLAQGQGVRPDGVAAALERLKARFAEALG